MRTEFKIGLAVGLLLLIVFVLVTLFRSSGDEPSGEHPLVRDDSQSSSPQRSVEPDPAVNNQDNRSLQVGYIRPAGSDTRDYSVLPTLPSTGGTFSAPATRTAVDAGDDEPLAPYMAPTRPGTTASGAPGRTGAASGTTGSTAPATTTTGTGATGTTATNTPSTTGTGSSYAGHLRGLGPSTASGAERNPDVRRTEPGRSATTTTTPGAAPSTLSGGTLAAPTRGTPREYVVQAGDSGFMAISERVYGTQRHWELIRDANPTVSSTSLRPGIALQIPPLPAGTATATATGTPSSRPAAEHGSVTTRPGGQRVYVVREGDAGYWGIARRVYGDGRHMNVLAAANPGVDTQRLRPGMEIIVPELPATTATGTAGASTPASGTSTAARRPVPAGFSEYTVQEGDAGFWGISVKVYGEGRHFAAIEAANPGLSANRLAPGTLVLIPPKPAGATATPATAASTAPSSRTSDPNSTGSSRPRPHFGP